MEGFIKVAAAVPRVSVADCRANTAEVESLMAQAEGLGVEAMCFPELCLTGYTCQDLFSQQLLLDAAEDALLRLADFSHNLRVTAIVGLPIAWEGQLFNCAAVLQGGKVLGLVPKTFIPSYKEFYEGRWFSSATSLGAGQTLFFRGQRVPLGAGLVFRTPRFNFGVELCEDLWAPVPPSSRLTLQGAEIIFNLSASDDLVGKHAYLEALVCGQSARCLAGYVYAGSGHGESTQDMVFGGPTFIAENGHLLAEGERFSLKPSLVVSEVDVEALRQERRVNTTFGAAASLLRHNEAGAAPRVVDVDAAVLAEADAPLQRHIDPLPFVPEGEALTERCEEILCIQSEGLIRRLEHTGAKAAVLGISGGLDSTLALLVCVNAFDRLGRDRKGILGITMPGFGTTGRTHANALALMEGLGVSLREIPIRDACMQHFQDLGIDPERHDVTYENCQARERTQILMDVANQVGGLVVGTGDLSELALGWATYNGDHMSMYGVNAGVPKTLVRHLVAQVARHFDNETVKQVLLDIVDTPISPELVPADPQGDIAQKTEELVGPYELHDFFLYHTLRHGARPAKVFRLACRAFDGTDSRVERRSETEIVHWLTEFYRRFFAQQFKRSCLPDGPKVGSVNLSPRGDWRMPSDAAAAAWLEECRTIQDALTPAPLNAAESKTPQS